MKQQVLRTATVFLSIGFISESAFALKPVSGKSNLSSEALLVELTGKDISKESDIDLYAEMVSAFHSNDEIGFKSRLQSMLERFPRSTYADNALYLAGRMAVEHGNFAQGIKYFSRIEKEYPRSNKLAAAMFAKAMTYKRMNLPEFAEKGLKEVRAKYPGSPESFRANAELKVIK